MWNGYDKAQLPLDYGADGVPPLHFLAKEVRHAQSLSIAERLLDRGAEIELIEELSGATALGWAASCGNVELGELLIGRGAEVNPSTQTWASPLALAEQYHQADAIELLERHGAET